jgi:hypothetical protein
MIKIELDIFSGNPNPRWTLSTKEADELFDRVMADKTIASPPKSVGNLGYRGFIIDADEQQSERFKRDNIPSRFYISKGRDTGTEKMLLDSTNAAGSTSDDVRQVAQDSIISANQAWAKYWEQNVESNQEKPNEVEHIGPTIGSPTPDIAPGTPPSLEPKGQMSAAACGPLALTSDTNFSFWNDSTMSWNNCYNFAANWKSNTFAQPGRKSNTPWTSLDCGNTPGVSIGYSAAFDGFTIGCWSGWEQLTALVIWPGTDYHWYRLCANNHWCHKPGMTPARNYDDSGNWIFDPFSCNRGPYIWFCSYRYFPHGWSVQ